MGVEEDELALLVGVVVLLRLPLTLPMPDKHAVTRWVVAHLPEEASLGSRRAAQVVPPGNSQHEGGGQHLPEPAVALRRVACRVVVVVVGLVKGD